MQKKLVLTLIFFSGLSLIFSPRGTSVFAEEGTQALEDISPEDIPDLEEFIPPSMRPADEETEGVPEADEPGLEETSPEIQRIHAALEKLGSEDPVLRKEGLEAIQNALANPQAYPFTPESLEILQSAARTSILNETYPNMLPQNVRAQWDTLALTEEQRASLEVGQSIEGNVGLSDRELRALQRYIIDLGKTTDTIHIAKTLVDDAVIGDTEGQRITENNRRIVREDIQEALENSLPSYGQLSEAQQNTLVTTIFGRSAHIANTIREKLIEDKKLTSNDFDEAGDLKP
ncbi:MAG: hypothetical protein HYY61_05765, partial [Deltaproteobacteria bacterium]|nr:hypothetical protein [Deltaproteobacteria bacterium]